MFGGEVEHVARLYAERLVPGVDVAYDAVHAKLAGAMGIRQCRSTHLCIARDIPPQLSPSEEKALVAGESANYRRGATLILGSIIAVGDLGYRQASKLPDSPAEVLPAVGL